MKKDDADLLLEVRDLNLERNESLAEFACRARIIFERMQYPLEFREQLKQILTKFNPHLAFEILNLPLRNYTEFLHYVNERNYLYRRSSVSHKNRTKLNNIDSNHAQELSDHTYDDIEIEGGTRLTVTTSDVTGDTTKTKHQREGRQLEVVSETKTREKS